MSLLLLIPVSVGIGLIALAGFWWSLRTGQYDDLDGAAARILNAPDRPDRRPDPLASPKADRDGR